MPSAPYLERSLSFIEDLFPVVPSGPCAEVPDGKPQHVLKGYTLSGNVMLVNLSETRAYTDSHVEMWKVEGAALAGMPVVGDDLSTRAIFERMIVGGGRNPPGTTLPLCSHYTVAEQVRERKILVGG